jgi:hypothetical protein
MGDPLFKNKAKCRAYLLERYEPAFGGSAIDADRLVSGK